MNPKLDAEKICNCVEDLAKGKLKNKEDLLRLTELALSSNNMKKLEELAFQAKFSQGILRIIQNKDNTLNEEYFASLKNEYMQSIQLIKDTLENLLTNASEFLKTIYKEKYFQLNLQSMNNLNDLCSDLVYLKYYLNDQK